MPDLDSEALDFRVTSEFFNPARTLRKRDFDPAAPRQVSGPHRPALRARPRAPLSGRVDPGGALRRSRQESHPRSYGVPRPARRRDRVHRETLPVWHRDRASPPNGSLELPPVAVREAAINAVAHADYAQRSTPIRISIFDDRLGIENPGLLPFGLTVADLEQGSSKLRNRVIGRVFRTCHSP